MVKRKIKNDIPCSDIDILMFMLKVLYGHDKRELAWRLVERFGDIRGVFTATHEELLHIPEMTDRVATFFNIAMPIRRQAMLRLLSKSAMSSTAAIIAFAEVYFMNEYKQLDVAMYLDGNDKIISVECLMEQERLREIVFDACRHDARKFVWIRYSLNADDNKDRFTARSIAIAELEELFKILDIEFVDYIEYSPTKWVCLKNRTEQDDPTESKKE